jgi:hypothetical protein
MAEVTNSQTQTELSAFARRVLYSHAGILVLLIVLIGAGGYFGLRSYDAQLAKAEVTEQKYEAAQKTLTDLLATDAQERAQMQAQQANLIGQIAKRDKTPPSAPVIAALQPNASAEVLALGLGSSFNDVSSFGVPQTTPDGKVALNGQETQEIIQDHEQGKKDHADLADTMKLYGLEQQKTASLTKDNVQCTTTLADAQKSITAYKKLAVRSRWQRFMTGAEKVTIFISGVALGHKL